MDQVSLLHYVIAKNNQFVEFLHDLALFNCRSGDLLKYHELAVAVLDHRFVPAGNGVLVGIAESLGVRLLDLGKSLTLDLEEFLIALDELAERFDVRVGCHYGESARGGSEMERRKCRRIG